jgi:hypothetical protein
MRWFAARMITFGKVIHSPECAFEGDLGGPSYLIPFIILGFVSIIISVLQMPVQIDWMQFHMESQGMQPEHIAASLRLVRQSSRFTTVIAPLLLFLRLMLIAAVLWMFALPGVDLLNFRQALNIVAYSYAPVLMRDTATCLVLLLRSPDVLHTSDGLNVALGLNLICRSIPMPWAQLAGSINLFEAWFVFLLVLGVAGVARVSRQKALQVVIPCWLLIAAVQGGLAYLGVSIQK